MLVCDVDKNSEESTCSWRRVAPHSQPLPLRSLSQAVLASIVSRTASQSFEDCKEDLHTVCHLLRSSLPLDVRTSVMREVTSTQDIEDPRSVMSLILLHLLMDVSHISLTAGANAGRYVLLEQEDCARILQELEGVQRFSLESLQLEGVWMENGLLSEILRRSPNISVIQVSGDLCREVLQLLQERPCNLRSLHLHNCAVSDEEVIKAIIGTDNDFVTLGNIICTGGDITEVQTVALKSLRSLSVQSHMLTVCGAMVLLHSLRELRHMQYTYWNCPISDTLLLLQKIRPEFSSALSSIDLWRPSGETLESMATSCPRLQRLTIEGHDTNLASLGALSEFRELSSLTLRIVSEELIVSAVKALGSNLLELKIEFEDYTFHPISLDTIRTIQEECPHLQRLAMLHVNIVANLSDRLPYTKKDVLTELKDFTLQSSLIQPALLERMVRGNRSLENLVLDVNQDALTDQVMTSLLRNNNLHNLTTIYLGAGSLTVRAITSLVALSSLAKLSLDLKRFPFIPVSTFSFLEHDLLKGNYRCVLENAVQED
ncbi:uncharacterized protein [Panulirus ornatus]|uniref:uncharacterized protein n=1 Tax=Panulirus ornatus TaxID=150431 RepID=UPI003A897953